MTPGTLPRKSVPAALGLCLVNWLVPGLGFFLVGDRLRGTVLFLIITFCFVVGALMGGYVLAPGSWHPRSPEFNLVTVLTYLAQSFNGGGWLLVQWLQGAAEGNPEAAFNLVRLGTRTYSDLGVLHYIVAGSLNYLATVRLYDLLAGTVEGEVSGGAEAGEGGAA